MMPYASATPKAVIAVVIMWKNNKGSNKTLATSTPNVNDELLLQKCW
jgi:hypothetical protein